MEFIRRLLGGAVNRETAQVDFLGELNTAIQNAERGNKSKKKDALEFLDYTIFKLPVSFQHKRTALEALLKYIEYHTIADKISLLIQETHDIYHKSEIIALIKPYRSVDPDHQPSTPKELLSHSRGLWKSGNLKNAVENFKQVLEADDTSVQEKLTCIHTMVNDCYNPEQKEAIAGLLDPIYTFLQDTQMSYASIRDVLTSIFRIRNITLQEANTHAFREHMNRWASSVDTYRAGIRGVQFYVIHKAWDWVQDAIEFARPSGKEVLWAYLTTWVTEPPFHADLPERERLKYQFFACEFLLQSYRPEQMQTAAEFLFNVTESEDYSTFVRGDALDVLLRNPIPRDLIARRDAIRDVLRVVREDTVRNQQLQQRELGNAFVWQGPEPGVGFEPGAIAGTTFDDSQNVHATEVNDAINESLLAMSKDQEIRGNTVYKVCDQIAEMIRANNSDLITARQKERAEAALARYIEDPAIFTEKRLKLGSVLVLIWNRIDRHAEKEEMSVRLIQELSEAFNTCATGHLSRAISVLVGYYPDIKQFASFEKQLENNIKARINSAVRKAPEDLQGDLLIAMADAYCPEYKIYREFTDKLRTPIYQELFGEFVPQYMSKDAFDTVFLTTYPR